MIRRLLWIAFCLLAACSKGGDEVAGTASNTETGELAGLLVFQGGTSAEGARVTLAPAAGRGKAVSAKPAASLPADTAVTDGQGRYSFKNLDSGAYDMSAVLIKDGDTLVAFRFDIPFGKTLFVGTDTLVAPGKIQVKVAAGGKPVEGVTCYIPGTSFIAISDAQGQCVISGIEPGTYDVAFQHSIYIGDGITGVEVVSGSKRILADAELRADPAKSPPAPLNLSAVYDRRTGVVTLGWDSVRVSDLDGYVIYRDTAASTAPTRLTQLVRETVFRDSVYGNLQDTSSKSLAYRIQAQDKDGNASLYSLFPAVTVTRPLLPSRPGPADGAMEVGLSPELSWAPVPGATGYTVYLSSGPHADSVAAQGLAVSSFQAAGLAKKTVYRWKVAAMVAGAPAVGPEWTFTTLDPDTVATHGAPFRNKRFSETQTWDSSTAVELNIAFWDGKLEFKLIWRSRIDKSFQRGTVYAGNLLIPEAGVDTLILESLYKRPLSGVSTVDTAQPGSDTTDVACAYAYDADQERLQVKCLDRVWQLSNIAGDAATPLLSGNYRGVAPVITLQPADVTAHPGDSAVFTVAATGTSVLKFDWRRFGGGACEVAGTATTSSCTLRNFTTEDNGATVMVTVSNAAGSVKSRTAELKVTNP